MNINADLGEVQEIDLRTTDDNQTLFSLQVRMPDGERRMFTTHREALRGLWSYLTQVLYPRAQDLTHYIITVSPAPEGTPGDVTYRFAAYKSDKTPDRVVIRGFTKRTLWKLTLDVDASENLWAALQDHLKEI